MKRFIQIRGCMGSCKTTIVRTFIQKHNFEVEFIEVFGKRYPYSIDKKNNIVCGGRYDKTACGGLDGIIKNRNIVREYIIKIIKQINPDLFIFEAVMYGLTFDFSNKLNGICKTFGYDYTAIVPLSPLEDVIQRIQQRNGGKPIKVERVEHQYTRCMYSSEKLKQNGVDVRYFIVSEYNKDNMYKILKEVICQAKE